MIRVGGATEIEVKERKDRVDDAMHATRAAVEEGVLPGGGVAAAARREGSRDGIKGENRRPAAPASTSSARRSPGTGTPDRQSIRPATTARLSSARSWIEDTSYAYGYDAQTGEYGDLVSKLGIIDPTKVVRIALQDASSIAGLLITTEAMVAELPKREVRRCQAAAAWVEWAEWTIDPRHHLKTKKVRACPVF